MRLFDPTPLDGRRQLSILNEYGALREFVLRCCRDEGYFHGEMLTDVLLVERNTIGVAVRELMKEGLIMKSSYRAGRNPASHGRASHEYRLTDSGKQAAVFA